MVVFKPEKLRNPSMCLHMCVYLVLWANNQFFKVCGIDSENIQTKNVPFPLPATDAGKY